MWLSDKLLDVVHYIVFQCWPVKSGLLKNRTVSPELQKVEVFGFHF